MTVGQKVIQVIEELGLTQEAAASVMQITRGSIASYKARANANPSREKVRRLIQHARQMNREIPEEWFFDGERSPVPSGLVTPRIVPGSDVSGLFNVAIEPTERIPIVGRASAGPGSLALDETPTEYLYVSRSLVKGDCVAFVAEGDSMMPLIQPGDRVVVTKSNQPRAGLTFLVRREDGEYSLKQVKWDAATSQWMWHSLNPAYAPEPAKGEILGLAITIWREVGTRISVIHDPSGVRPD